MADRRDFLRYCAGSAAAFVADRPSAGQSPAVKRVAFRLREAAGLRRFHYPVHAIMPIHASEPGLNYRLLLGGKEVPAQFCRVTQGVERPGMALDFSASPGPFETQDYTIEYGAGLKSRLGPGRGLTAGHGEGTFRISNGSSLTYAIPDDLAGLVGSIKTPGLEFLQPNSRGLFLKVRGSDREIPIRFVSTGEGAAARWTRQGPFAVGLRFEGKIATTPGTELRTTVDLTFVNTKSWIEGVWTIEDPNDRVGSMALDLAMRLDGPPALVDCGAGSTVYSHLRNDETLVFTGNPPASPDERRPRWTIEQGKGTDRKPFATAPANSLPPEGWIHLMDRSRCSALAIADFATNAADRFRIQTDGRIEFERRFPGSTPAAPNRQKFVKFWLHVVPMPVQVGAVTSPQAMLSPLSTEWMG